MRLRGSRSSTPLQAAVFLFRVLRRLLAVSIRVVTSSGNKTSSGNNKRRADGPPSTIYPLF
jgi:hypothetical protein